MTYVNGGKTHGALDDQLAIVLLLLVTIEAKIMFNFFNTVTNQIDNR